MAKKENEKPEVLQSLNSNSQTQVKAFIERIEALREEKAGLSEDEREVFAEAKANGFDTVAMRETIKHRKLDSSVFEEREFMRAQYFKAVGLSAVHDLA